MKWIKTLIAIIALLLAFVLAALAVNQTQVALTFAYWQTPFELSIFWWLMAAFILGLFFGLINTFWVNTKHRLANRKLQRDLATQTAEVERLRQTSAQAQPQTQP